MMRDFLCLAAIIGQCVITNEAMTRQRGKRHAAARQWAILLAGFAIAAFAALLLLGV